MAAAAAAALLLSAPLGMVVDPACAAPAVRLSRILPMMPAVSPEAAAERVVQFAADVGPSQLAWVPSSDVFTGDAEAVRSVERLAFLAGGSQWAWTEGGAPPQQLQPAAAAPVETHAVSAPAELAAVGGGEVWVRDLDAGGSAPVLSVAGADGAGGLLALSSGRFLLASGGGRLLLLEQDEGLEGLGGIGGRPPEWQALELLPDGALGGPLRSLCVSSTEDELFFAAGGGTPPTSLPQVPDTSHASPSHLRHASQTRPGRPSHARSRLLTPPADSLPGAVLRAPLTAEARLADPSRPRPRGTRRGHVLDAPWRGRAA